MEISLTDSVVGIRMDFGFVWHMGDDTIWETAPVQDRHYHIWRKFDRYHTGLNLSHLKFDREDYFVSLSLN